MPNPFTDAAVAYLVARLNRTFAPFALVPFNFLNGISDGQRIGGGQARVGVTVAAGTPVVVPHSLARVPAGVLVLDNGTTAQTPLQITARSSTSVTVVPLTAALSASSVLFIF